MQHRRIETELAQTKRGIELEVRDAVIAIERSRDAVASLKTLAQQARGLLEVAKARFALGLATNRDITDAQEDLLEAETDLLRASVDYNVGVADLQAAIGGP